MPRAQAPSPPRRSRKHAIVAAAMAASLLVGACAWLLARGSDKPTVNVVIVLIDTLRADRLGCYGYSKPTSPRIDALAKDSVLFEQACAPSPWTLPTVPALMTSKLPCEHQVLVDGDMLAERHATLAERLKSIGYHTYSLYYNPYAGPLTGLGRGFDFTLQTLETGNTNGAFVDSFLARFPATPFFLYIHNTEPHNAYEAQERLVRALGGAVPPETVAEFKRLSERLRTLGRVDADAHRPLGSTNNSAQQKTTLDALDGLRPQVDMLYDATVLEADENVGSIIDTLRKRGLWDNTLFILLADHGEEMGEHGGWQHDQSLYEELMHVPLLVHFPKGQYGGKRMADTVGLIDVFPTIAGALGRADLSNGARGRSLLPLVRGEKWRSAAEPVVYSVRWNKKKFYKPWKETRGDYQIAVRQERWKLIYSVETKMTQLFDLVADPGEKNDLTQAQPKRAASLRQFAERFVAECDARATGAATGGVMDPASRKQLAGNGYIEASHGDDDEPPTTQPASSPASQTTPR